jgi:hypothetical protein
MRAATSILVAWLLAAGGCADPEYDASTPQAAVDSMRQMIADGRAERLAGLLHIEARDMAFDDGVTEASAIRDVLEKAGDMFGRLYRVAFKIRDRFPGEAARELESAENRLQRPGDPVPNLARFLADPFGLLDEQSQRLTVEDLSDGTAAILVDGKPALGGVGLLLREIDGAWKIDIPIQLLQEWRPNTRHEWAVLASMMLSLENSLKDFERELDEGRFPTLEQAGRRAGRILGESVVIQALLYRGMKDQAD